MSLARAGYLYSFQTGAGSQAAHQRGGRTQAWLLAPTGAGRPSEAVVPVLLLQLSATLTLVGTY